MSVHFVMKIESQTEKKKTRVYLHLWESEASIYSFYFVWAAAHGDLEEGR